LAARFTRSATWNKEVMPKTDDIRIRFVVVRGVRYLRIEDVVAFVQDLAATEDPNARRRIEQAASHLMEGR